MRISEQSAKLASEILASQYGENAGIWLFGSRTNDNMLGGDVDIFVESESTDALKRIHCKTILTELFDLKVDLIVGEGDQPIHRIAKATGVRINSVMRTDQS